MGSSPPAPTDGRSGEWGVNCIRPSRKLISKRRDGHQQKQVRGIEKNRAFGLFLIWNTAECLAAACCAHLGSPNFAEITPPQLRRRNGVANEVWAAMVRETLRAEGPAESQSANGSGWVL